MDSSCFKQLIKDKFDARTEYDKDNKRHPKLAVELVQRANLQSGWAVLDLACGTGFVTFLAADKVGSSGYVAGVDISSVMIQQVHCVRIFTCIQRAILSVCCAHTMVQALHKLESSGFSNVCFEIGDLEDCSFPDDFFDAILCSQAMFYIDLKSVSKKLHAWLKPGGILAYNSHQVVLMLLQCIGCLSVALDSYRSKPACWATRSARLTQAVFAYHLHSRCRTPS